MNLRFALAALIALPFAVRAEPPAVEQALARAKVNRPELERALNGVAPDQRAGMAFLIANMPDSDLTQLKADFLITNVELAYKARAEVPWGKHIPEEIFLNDVLPYANVDERRDAWRAEFYDLCLPLVRDCKTPAEAARKLNSELFQKLKLGYSTQRKAPNQSPKESIEQGKASCTGLSIVLSDACRAMCIPARIVGTPMWANKRGNHTWVEIWDAGWHFTGACEQDPGGLNRGWFVGDAAQAKRDSPEHAIYAASFRKSPIHFPLVWARGNKNVPAENVTDRYAKKSEPQKDVVRVSIRVLDANKKRLVAPVVIVGVSEPKFKTVGQSRGESADLNDLLGFDLKPEQEYEVVVTGAERQSFKTGKVGQSRTIEVVLVDR